ncbi:Peroxisomal fatty acid beta-oxidation multifunctional protein [Zostera marina]|uniref:Peroxisomal fatty acid beta-oxidation multifunctional protein n=1 Tax=Zostera marina TaxID=29655 RepID=A0A0K9NTQ8_ZOSMR|nr:Peroxisomal fatty acid beta-oxidation multifunctional protein [Zostera marina]
MEAGLSVEIGTDGVAVITISNPPQNVLTVSISGDLKQSYKELMNRDDVKAIVITGASDMFSGGFDIMVFAKVLATGDLSLLPDVSVDILIRTIEDGKKPTVAAIQGLALGGGFELAMACHGRVSVPDAILVLPELNIGVIPGMGGTQRLPRLAGLPKAIEMLMHSKPIMGKEGMECGLIDELTSPSELLKVARRLALDIADKSKPFLRSLHLTDKLCSVSESQKMIEEARQIAKTMSPNTPQQGGCLDAIEEGIVSGGSKGIQKEAAVFAELVLKDTTKALFHVLFAEMTPKEVPNVTDIGLKPNQISKVGVIGGGLMGSGIAISLIQNNISVVLKEIDSNFLQKGMNLITGNLESLMKKGMIPEEKMSNALKLVKGTLDYSEFSDVDMVIETVDEKIWLKQAIFEEIEKICPPHCILATNTSTIDLNVIGQKTCSQDRIIGAHFFSPAHLMSLLEIVRTEKTSSQVILDVLTLAKSIAKFSVISQNCTGFAVNRTFFPYAQAAHLLASLGVDLFRIDSVVKNFGMPMGPFQLQDLAGYDVVQSVEKEFVSSFKDGSFDSNLVELMVENGRNGKANGKGYYIYQKGVKPISDPTVEEVVKKFRSNGKNANATITPTDKDILEMIFFPVVNEACRVMEESVVTAAVDLDIASIHGMGFPKYRGGLIFWADSIGAGYILERLKKWEEAHGVFFKPSHYLEERASNGMLLSE